MKKYKYSGDIVCPLCKHKFFVRKTMQTSTQVIFNSKDRENEQEVEFTCEKCNKKFNTTVAVFEFSRKGGGYFRMFRQV